MSHLNIDTLNKIPQLFSSHLVVSPLPIRAGIGNILVDAILTSNGSVDIGGDKYSDIEKAMQAVNPLADSTSNAWQFWAWYSDERKAWTPLEHLRAKLEGQDNPPEVKTSLTHPLRIDSVLVPGVSGRIGLTFCPGKITEGLYSGIWERDLVTDINAVKTWGGKVLISLMEDHEFSLLGVPDFASVLPSVKGLEWLHLPIKDMQIPDGQFEKNWDTIGADIHKRLSDGDSIVIHCRGGLGRTGLLAARILVEFGMEPVQAVAAVRQSRERSIETYLQEHYILTRAWENNT